MIYCRCCGEANTNYLFKVNLLSRDVSYFECLACGYVQTEFPSWLEDAYLEPINPSDTGIVSRNLSNVSLVLATLALMGKKTSQVVDYGGGHGFLVRLLRDIGVNALWADPYSENLVARGFEYQEIDSYAREGEKPSLVMAFEAFEHFVEPAKEVSRMLSISSNILLTTTLAPQPTPRPTEWSYYGFEHGQHIGFYRVQTLQYLADSFGLQLMTDGVSTHFLSRDKRYSYLAWKMLRILARRIPRLFVFGLHSKTWDDHLIISEGLADIKYKKKPGLS